MRSTDEPAAAASAAAPVPAPVDGRTARALRTREAIVDACIVLVEEGDLQPTAPRVADRAGVSVRSVFQHFDDLEGLFSAVGDRVLERLSALVIQIDPDLPLDRRVGLVVRQRAALWEAFRPIRLAGIINGWDSPEIAVRLQLGYDYIRAELAAVFGAELQAAGERGSELLDAIDVVLSLAAWEHLRTLAGHEIDSAIGVAERLLSVLLAAYG